MRAEEISETKEFYWVSLIVVVALWISAIVFTKCDLFGVIPRIFSWAFIPVLFGYFSNYKSIMKFNSILKIKKPKSIVEETN